MLRVAAAVWWRAGAGRVCAASTRGGVSAGGGARSTESGVRVLFARRWMTEASQGASRAEGGGASSSSSSSSSSAAQPSAGQSTAAPPSQRSYRNYAPRTPPRIPTEMPAALKGARGSGGAPGSGGGAARGGADGQQENTLRDLARNPLVWLGAGGVALAGMQMVSNSKRMKNEISFEEFQSIVLPSGKVEGLRVVNDNGRSDGRQSFEVRVQFAPGFYFDADTSTVRGVPGASIGHEEHKQQQQQQPQQNAEQKSVSVRNAEARREFEKQSQQLFFTIGSVNVFEERLEEAQRALGVEPSKHLQVAFVDQVNWGSELWKLAPNLLFIAGIIWIYRRTGVGGMSNVFKINKSKATLHQSGEVKVKFKDVAGLQEAKQEVMEFVDFLRSPEKYQKLGAKIPKGALLVGPPGTGKTLLAKAVAGEASVPFFSIAGSDFLEMVVGVGPSRVRDLFAQAREKSPCIVFIDEIDAIGRKRSEGGGNDERENTVNQLLVEMDGLKDRSGVVVLAGTNRPDILDSALTRAGRFDRHIVIDKPDIKARKQIFEVHLQSLKLQEAARKISRELAAMTPGMSGAEISNVCNEAALFAAREGKKAVDMGDFRNAIDRVIAGLERRSRVLSDKEKTTVAYHEAGHAVSGWFLEHAEPLLKVSIVPRGAQALGFTMYLPKDRNLMSQAKLFDMMCMTLGGRVAEMIFFNRITTGAADDLDRVTQNAYAQVVQLGMDKVIGPVSYKEDDSGMDFQKPFSEQTARQIDERVRDLVNRAFTRTYDLLQAKKPEMERVAQLLLEREVITQADVRDAIGPRPFAEKTSYEQFVGAQDSDDEADKRTPAGAPPASAAAAAPAPAATESAPAVPST